MKKITGTVIGVIYVNQDNGYAVLEIDADSEYFVAVGIFPPVEEGELLTMTGEFKKNPKFGEQFCVDKAEFAKPSTNEAMIKYLSSGLFKGIGEVMAREIVGYFGNKTMEIIENSPELLKKVRGIGEKTLLKIVESYNNTRQMKESILFLQQFEMSMNLALKIYNKYGSNTIDIIKFNPYSLVMDIDGVGFTIADKIAKQAGIEEDSEFRIKAGLYHVLREASIRGGHTCLPDNVLIDKTSKLIGISDYSLISNCLADLDNVKKIAIDGNNISATAMNYNTEKSIAGKLLMLNQAKEKWEIDLDKAIGNFQKINNIALHKTQKEAIKSVFENGVSVITGGPGTGKTTIIKCIVDILEQHKMRAVLCAPTGRASKRMSEATDSDAMTIHRLLGMQINTDGTNKFVFNKTNPLEADVVIIDEISMADIYIFNALINAVPFGARIIMVGDKNQLPSVSCGNILDDIISSQMFNVVSLTEVYRQGKGSMIVVNAHRINNGLMPETKDAEDFFIDNKTESLDILNSVISMTKERIPNFSGIPVSNIQVLCPIKKGTVGVNNLNKELQKALNKNTKQLLYKDNIFNLGDRVMHTVNNYNLEWEDVEFQKGKGVFNGDIGYICSIDNGEIEVLYDDGRRVVYKGADIDQLSLAYCISIHKSQGSEFDVAIIAVGGGSSLLMTRNLLYTAVTRAKKMAVIVGGKETIMKMVGNNYTAKRYSLLRVFLTGNKEKVKSLWGNLEG